MTPSEKLQAAADRIRDLAAAATPGSWKHEYGVVQEDESVTYAVEADSDHWVGELRTAGDAAWVAALCPAASPALEAILRSAAHDVEVSSMVLNSDLLAKRAHGADVLEARAAADALFNAVWSLAVGLGVVEEDRK